MRALATWCVRHRRLVVLFWIAALVVVSLVAKGVGCDYSNSFSLPKTESTDAIQLLQAASPKVSGDVDQIVFADIRRRPRSPIPPSRPGSTPCWPRWPRCPTSPTSSRPTEPKVPPTSARTAPIAFATVTFDKQAQNLPTSLATTSSTPPSRRTAPGLHVAVSGQLAEAVDQGRHSAGPGSGSCSPPSSFCSSSGRSSPWPCRSISALASLGTAIGLIGLLSNVMKMPEFSTTLVLLIGLGVGIDYALFIVTRHRQGLIAGEDPETSIVNAVNTSGRAVLFAGIIVCIALLGMFALGVSASSTAWPCPPPSGWLSP